VRQRPDKALAAVYKGVSEPSALEAGDTMNRTQRSQPGTRPVVPLVQRTATRLQTPLRLAAVLLAGVALAGCENMSARQTGTAQGAGVGAVAGAVLGGVTGGNAGRSAVIGGALGAIAGNLWSKRMEDKRKDLEAATAGTGIEVARTADNRLRVNVPADLSFATGSAMLQPGTGRVLDRFAEGLDGSMQVRIIGHTDSTGSDAINDPLSQERARSVRDHLQDRGVPASRMDVVGRGSREPLADNGSETGRARNRRVELFLSEPQG
jgi:outer membrane protein OmpA-like peptidoglycan-associated protein